METLLIIGATGRTATTLANVLATHDKIQLKLTTSREPAVAELQTKFPRAQVCIADWHDRDSLIAAFSGVDRVVMIPPDFVLDERLAIDNIVAAYEANPRVKHLVRMIAIPEGATSQDMAPEYLNLAAGTALHLVGKEYLAQTNLPLTYLNMLAWFTSNIPWFFADDVRQLSKLRLPGYDVARAYLCEEDMADAFVTVLTQPVEQHLGKEYILTSQQRFRFEDIARELSALLKRPIEFENTDQGLLESNQGLLSQYIQFESRTWQEYGEPSRNDISLLIGREPLELPLWLAQHRAYFS